MQEDTKQPGLSWSSPKANSPQGADESPKTAPVSLANISIPIDAATLQTQAPLYAGFLVAGVIAGVFLATGWSSYGRAVSATATSTSQAANTAASLPSDTSGGSETPLTVEDQKAGGSVTISRLNIAKPTWVVVYVSREGKPGNALGARLFFPGDKQGQVGLLRDTARGQSYFVGLSVDNGDKVFSLTKDKPLADADGGALWATFTAR